MKRRSRFSLAVATCASFLSTLLGGELPSVAQAEPPDVVPLVFSADEVHLDAHSRAIAASGHVQIDEPPFHLTSDALRLRRVAIGAELDGEGKLSFCPCLGTPLAVRFHSATVAPPHDVILRSPVLEVFGVPVAWAPVLWLRSPGRFGLLPPDLSWRGADGFFAGAGLHVPWHQGDIVRGVDVRAGAYFDGGVAVQVAVRATTSETRVAWDRLRTDGVALEARGATAIANGARPESAAWKVDALRGARAVKMTTDVDLAARPFDRGAAEVTERMGGWTVGSAVRSTAVRGGGLTDFGASGPVILARRSDALASWGAYDATVEGGALTRRGAGTLSFARGEGGILLAGRLGPVGATLGVRGLADVGDDGRSSGLDAAGEVRAAAGLPLSRDFVSRDEGDPWVHRTEPRLALAAIAIHESDALVVPAGRGMTAPAGGAWVAAASWYNGFGRVGSPTAAELDVSVGAVGRAASGAANATPVLRSRATWQGSWLGWNGELARVLASSTSGGGVVVAHARLGPASGLRLTAHVAERDGVDPLVARALVEAPLEPASGFSIASGWTGGGGVALPVGPRITTRAGADVDLAARELVAALGAIELHDPCNCVVVRATAAHRIGREGVDLWVSIDLAAR